VDIVKLWYHECKRVFYDRLINEEDRESLNELLQEQFKVFGVASEEVLD